MLDTSYWAYSADHGQLCQVIETQTLWGETIWRVWLPGTGAVVRIRAPQLQPVEHADTCSADDVA